MGVSSSEALGSSPQSCWRSPKTILKRSPTGNSIISQPSYVRSGRTLSPVTRRPPLVPVTAQDRSNYVGRTISVPYSLIISDDYSGCSCESVVLEKASRGYLVTLAGEPSWQTESFIRQWLCSSQQADREPAWSFASDDWAGSPRESLQADADALNDLLAKCVLGSIPSPDVTADTLSRVPTSLAPLDGLVATMEWVEASCHQQTAAVR